MRIVGNRILYRGCKFNLAEHELETDSGSIVRREYIDHSGAVVILPIADDGRIVVLRNYRHALDKVLWEVPAGTRSPDEPPEVTAARELTEETGYVAGRVEKLLEFYPAPGISNERMFVFLATQLTSSQVAREIDESMEVVLMTVDLLREMIRTGELEDGKTMLAFSAWLGFSNGNPTKNEELNPCPHDKPDRSDDQQFK